MKGDEVNGFSLTYPFHSIDMSTIKHARITWVDYAKGIGISLVVFGHTLRGIQNSGIIADSSAFRSVDSWIYSFHMPLFYLLSGLFAERRVERGAGEFFREKLSTLAYPYLIWSTLQTLVQFSVGRHTNHQTSLHDLARILIDPIMQFWFLYALFLISLIYYFLRRCGLGPLAALAIFALFWSTQGWVSLGTWLPLNATRTNGLYYALGCVMGRHGWIERFERASMTPMLLTALLGYGVVTVGVAQPLPPNLPLILILALCGISASIALAVLLTRTRDTEFIRVLGVYSLEIYVAHTIASAGIRIALQKVLKVQDATTHLVIGTVGGLLLPAVLGLLCRRYHAEFLFRFPQGGTKARERRG